MDLLHWRRSKVSVWAQYSPVFHGSVSSSGSSSKGYYFLAVESLVGLASFCTTEQPTSCTRSGCLDPLWQLDGCSAWPAAATNTSATSAREFCRKGWTCCSCGVPEVKWGTGVHTAFGLGVDTHSYTARNIFTCFSFTFFPLLAQSQDNSIFIQPGEFIVLKSCPCKVSLIFFFGQ